MGHGREASMLSTSHLTELDLALVWKDDGDGSTRHGGASGPQRPPLGLLSINFINNMCHIEEIFS